MEYVCIPLCRCVCAPARLPGSTTESRDGGHAPPAFHSSPLALPPPIYIPSPLVPCPLILLLVAVATAPAPFPGHHAHTGLGHKSPFLSHVLWPPLPACIKSACPLTSDAWSEMLNCWMAPMMPSIFLIRSSMVCSSITWCMQCIHTCVHVWDECLECFAAGCMAIVLSSRFSPDA